MWSTDNGLSWTSPVTIPNVVARQWTDPFDTYDMAADSLGHIHLVVGGYPEEAADQLRSGVDMPPYALYDLVWDGSEWSLPAVIYKDDWYAEYPHIVIEKGNQLHVTWFVREDLWKDETPHQVWYAHSWLQTPEETPVPPATRTPTPTPEPVATSTPLPTPFPTVMPDATPLPDGLYTDADDTVRMAVALAPVALVLIVVIGIKLRWFRRP